MRDEMDFLDWILNFKVNNPKNLLRPGILYICDHYGYKGEGDDFDTDSLMVSNGDKTIFLSWDDMIGLAENGEYAKLTKYVEKRCQI